MTNSGQRQTPTHYCRIFMRQRKRVLRVPFLLSRKGSHCLACFQTRQRLSNTDFVQPLFEHSCNDHFCGPWRFAVLHALGIAGGSVCRPLGEFRNQPTSGRVKLTALKILRKALNGPLHTIPGPWYSRFTNVVLKYKTLVGQRVFYVHELHQRYGPVVRLEPGEVNVCDLDAFRKIHRIGSGFVKSDWYRLSTSGIEDNVFAMTDVSDHAARRRLLARPFSRSSLLSNFQEMVAERARLAVSKMKDEASKGPCDVMKWWTLMTTDVIARVAFGEESCLLEAGQVSHDLANSEHHSQGASSSFC